METVKKFFPTRKCKDSFNFEHVWSLAIFPKNVKLRSQPLNTLLVLIKHDTQYSKSLIIVIRKRRRRSETYEAAELNEVQLVKTSIKEQNGSAKLKQAMFLSNNCQLKFSRRRKETRAASILTSFRIVIKVEWCTETLSFHTVIWKVSKKHIDVICFTHFPQSNKT